jgi:hypothetical protein
MPLTLSGAPTRAELDAIGTQDEAEITLTKADVEAILNPDERLAEWQKAEFDAWDISMEQERDMLKQAFEHFPAGITIHLSSRKEKRRVLFRLYRAKRMLLAKKTNYAVKSLAFVEGDDGISIIIAKVPDLKSRVTINEG